MRCHSFERLDTGRCRKQRCSPRHRVIYIGDVLILPTALWILRFKRNIFFSPFPSLDLCFLSAVTRTSRSSLRGKPREGEATGELLLSAANPRREVPLLFSPTHPSSHSPFPLPLFSRQPSSTPYYVDPSDVLYFTSILRPLPGGNILHSIHSFIMNVYVFDKIPPTCLLISIRKPERCDVKATAR